MPPPRLKPAPAAAPVGPKYPVDLLPADSKCVIDLRGTHGSAKSTFMRSILKMERWEPIVGEGRASKGGPLKERHLGFHCDKWDAAILGNYNLENTSGGCDNIQDPDEVCRRLRVFTSTYRLVFLEGVLVSHTFQRYNDLAVELEGGDDALLGAGPGLQYRFYFLDTPLDVCIERVRLRNAASVSANVKPFRDINVRKDYHNIWNTVRAKCREAGRRVYEVDHRDPLRQILTDLSLPLS